MTFFKRISEFVPIITSPETQTENPSQPQTQPNANLGIASNVDSFEVASQNNLFMDPQFQPANVIDSDATVSNTFDPSDLFNYVRSSETQTGNPIRMLNERMNALNERRQEIQSQIQDLTEQQKEAMKAAYAIRKALKDDQIGGLEGIVDTIGGVFGLSEGYQEKMERKAAEFERKAEELGASIKELMLELQEINKESESITDQIQAAEERQKELAAPAKVFMDSGSMVAEQAFQIFEVDQNMIQSNQQGSEQTEMEKMKETLENIQRKFSEVGDDITSSIK